uniref:RNA ligase domain-containing protein n=1 Tax=Thermosporothrix sp. COM3 TaxID=2490863 RepID=A0A455SF71_9CHLR|nr:hypothetical protein KTC_11470 [Thermosporothrix sp. COM3]
MYWTTYEKIAESPEQWHLDEGHYRTLKKARWVVTEKIHGAHFCIVTDGLNIVGASRKHLLAPDEHFFDYQRILQRLESQVVHLVYLIRQSYPQLTSLSIYGELFGGSYPHPDVPPIPGVQPVQTGIYYTPDIEFCAFDLALTISQQTAYLDYDRAHQFLQSAGIPSLPPLFIGSYQEALLYPVEFSSTIPALFGLPPLSQENNAEGVVIKPLKTAVFSTVRGPIRPILKRKIAAFAEDRRFHQAQKWSSLPSIADPTALDLLKWEASCQITENRLLSAISKTGYRGPRQQSRSQHLFHLFITDVLEQLSLHQSDLLGSLTPLEHQELLAFLQTEARTLFKQFFQTEKRRV